MIILHIDMNMAAFTYTALENMIDKAANIGYDAILWELEDKIRWETCPECVNLDAMTKDEFKKLLERSRAHGLVNIPLLQTLGHAEYVLTHEKYFKFREKEEFYDCYCPSNHDFRTFIKTWITEYLDLFGSDTEFFHLGGDEAYIFGTCENCSKIPKENLFAEYYNDLASVLRERNIRPCIWGDMFIHCQDKNPPAVGFDFVIFDWNYAADKINDFTVTQKIADLGYDVIVSSSSASHGDSPFIPRWNHHARNIAAAALTARIKHLMGTCVTSWSIRLNPKMLQEPLWEIAPVVMNGRTSREDIDNTISSACEKYYCRNDESIPEAFGKWHTPLNKLNAVGWTGFKDSRRAPENYLENVLKEINANPDTLLTMQSNIKEMLSSIDAALKKIARYSTPFVKRVREGAYLKKRYLEIISEILRAECVINDNILVAEKLHDDIKRYFAYEQSYISADNNAALVMECVTEYLRSKSVSD